MMVETDVGYKKPPKHAQFKKGKSGNPNGRPKRPKDALPAVHEERVKALTLEEAYRLVEVREGGKIIKLPLIQVLLRRLGVAAVQGRSRAARYFLDMLRMIEEENSSAYSAYVKQVIDYKAEVGLEFNRRKKLNPAEPDPIPHPDDIIINTYTGKVELRGPMTKEEEIWWDRIETTDAEIAKLTSMLASDPKNKMLKSTLEQERRLRNLAGRAVPDYKPRPSRRKKN